MSDALDIAELARRTGLSSRTLRFYEARGLVKPLRTDSGRRLYGRAELERINQIVALKRTGLTLVQIRQLLDTQPPDLARIVDVQLAALVVRQKEIADAIKLLISLGERLQRGETIEIAALCELIRQAETRAAESREWKQEAAKPSVSEERIKMGVERMWAVLSGIDPKEHRRKCADLYARIEAALPLDLDDPRARTFYEEWQALQEPFKATTTSDPLPPAPAVDNVLAAIDRWNAQAKAPFATEVWQFLFTLGRRREREDKPG